jgi:hypothetical protein
MSIVGVYAPINSYPEKGKDQFWETLKDVLDKISSTSEIFLMGGFNARVGKEDDQIVGRFGEEEINNNVERLKEVCDYYNLKISNIFFEHRDVHKYTWIKKWKFKIHY